MTLYQKLRVWYYVHTRPKRTKLNLATLLECHRVIEAKKQSPTTDK